MSLKTTPLAAIPTAVAACRAAFKKGNLRTVEQRKVALRKIVDMVRANETAIIDAVKQDIGKPAFETQVMELGLVYHEAFHALDHLSEWMGPQKVDVEGIQRLDTNYVKRDPLGVVLIIGAWNYPIQLTLVGVVGAVAAGNTVVIKPSELSPATSTLIGEMVKKYLPSDLVTVVQGGIPETSAVLKERFDHILYTGNSRVAKIVMAAAAQYLTPVTLELGGKSPCIVDSGINVAAAAQRILWGRVINAGQSCIAPDYILVKPAVKDELVRELKAACERFLGKDAKSSPDYARIINDMHYERVCKLMDGGKIIYGGERDKATRFIAPTIIDNVNPNSELMTDEIFGPLLPLIPYNTVDEAIDFVNAREKPLALYVFSNNKTFVSAIEQATSSGAFTVNDTMMHAAVAGLPFGGVGHSGMGAYHGKHTFNTFTHAKAVLKRDLHLEFLNRIRYPPYTDRNRKLLEWVAVKKKESGNTMIVMLVALFVATFAISIYARPNLLQPYLQKLIG